MTELKITGSGTATPPGEKFPGAYDWRDPGLLVNIHYGPKRYVRPCPILEMGDLANFSLNRSLLGHPFTRASTTHLKVLSPSYKRRVR